MPTSSPSRTLNLNLHDGMALMTCNGNGYGRGPGVARRSSGPCASSKLG